MIQFVSVHVQHKSVMKDIKSMTISIPTEEYTIWET